MAGRDATIINKEHGSVFSRISVAHKKLGFFQLICTVILDNHSVQGLENSSKFCSKDNSNNRRDGRRAILQKRE